MNHNIWQLRVTLALFFCLLFQKFIILNIYILFSTELEYRMTKKFPTFSVTCFPNVTSPDTVRWSNSNMSGILANLVRKCFTWNARFEPDICRQDVKKSKALIRLAVDDQGLGCIGKWSKDSKHAENTISKNTFKSATDFRYSESVFLIAKSFLK